MVMTVVVFVAVTVVVVAVGTVGVAVGTEVGVMVVALAGHEATNE